MANSYKVNSSCQIVITDGDINTSNIVATGRLKIDWNKYKQKKGLLDCLKFGTSSVDCNVPNIAQITMAGDAGAGV